MEDDSDETVWRMVLSGDSRRYGTIWDRHRDRVFRHLISRGHSASNAEDLTATTFLELWRRRGAVRFVDGSLLPWLILTAHNVSRNAARAARRYERFLAALPPPPSVPDPADSFAERDDDRLTALRAAMEAARPADAKLLALTALEGFTMHEAATALGISDSAAKMRLSRLRGRLRVAIPVQPASERGA